MLPDARARGYKAGRFSFNVKGGRCETCQGDGVIAIEMHFLPDVYVTCEECKGRRYNRETLEIKYRGKSIADMLELTVDQALPLVENFPPIAVEAADAAGSRPRLHHARPVGDDAVGRRGAARQAVAGAGAARHRAHAVHPRRADDRACTSRTCASCSTCSRKLVDQGNTVVVIEHNLDVIKSRRLGHRSRTRRRGRRRPAWSPPGRPKRSRASETRRPAPFWPARSGTTDAGGSFMTPVVVV